MAEIDKNIEPTKKEQAQSLGEGSTLEQLAKDKQRQISSLAGKNPYERSGRETNLLERNNSEINKRNTELAQNNPYGFTDIVRKKAKPHGTYRIAVLGDSFIWGDGIPHEEIWSHKLESRLEQDYPEIEMMHWGKKGWSTMDEYDFFIKEGFQYKIDLLIFGFVFNDTDMKEFKHLDHRWKRRIGYIYKLFPFMASVLKDIIDQVFEKSFQRWVARLYDSQNLLKYSELLKKIAITKQEYNLKTLFVLTPDVYFKHNKQYYEKIIPLLEEANLDYFNLYPKVSERLGKFKPDELQCNPVNSHPGPIMTDLFADEVLKFLEDNEYIGD